MRTIKIFAIALFAIALSVNAQSQTVIVEEVRQFNDNMLAEFNSGDYDAYLSRFADNFQGYAGVHSPFLFSTKAEWAAFIQGMESLAAANYLQRDASYRSFNDNTVLVNAYFTFTTVTKGGEVAVQNGREATTYVKIGNSWKLANYHFSPLF